VLIVDFVSLVFQTTTENKHDTQTKIRETKYRYRRYCQLKIPISYRLKKWYRPITACRSPLYHVER